MAIKLLSYLLFFLIETVIILGSILVVVCLYLPFVVIKGLVLTATGKAGNKSKSTDNLASPAG